MRTGNTKLFTTVEQHFSNMSHQSHVRTNRSRKAKRNTKPLSFFKNKLFSLKFSIDMLFSPISRRMPSTRIQCNQHSSTPSPHFPFFSPYPFRPSPSSRSTPGSLRLLIKILDTVFAETVMSLFIRIQINVCNCLGGKTKERAIFVLLTLFFVCSFLLSLFFCRFGVCLFLLSYYFALSDMRIGRLKATLKWLKTGTEKTTGTDKTLGPC